MNLDKYDNRSSGYDAGRNIFIQCVWYVLNNILFSSFLPGSAWRVKLLNIFGASISKSVVIKPYTKIKFPWKLTVGENTWIGEEVWIDNLDKVFIGSNTCLSQGAYICTGSHDWSSPSFDLMTRSVNIGSKVWICAKVVIAPGAIIEEGAVVTLSSLASGRLKSWSVYSGVPATLLCERKGVSEN